MQSLLSTLLTFVDGLDMTRSFHWNVAAVRETTFANNDANLSVEQAKKHQKSAGTRNTPTLVVAPL